MLAIFSFFRIPVPESLFFLRCSGHTIEVSTIFHYYTICKQKLNIHGTRTAASVVKQNNENNMWLSRPQYYLVSIQSINHSHHARPGWYCLVHTAILSPNLLKSYLWIKLDNSFHSLEISLECQLMNRLILGCSHVHCKFCKASNI